MKRLSLKLLTGAGIVLVLGLLIWMYNRALFGPPAVREALVADDAAGEVDQDWRESGGPLPVRVLPDGGGPRAQAAVPGNSGADTTVAAARDGTGMTPTKDETAGEGGGDGDGLSGSTANRHPPSDSVCIMARERSDVTLPEPDRGLLNPKIVIESSERPTAVAARSLSGKSHSTAVPGHGSAWR